MAEIISSFKELRAYQEAVRLQEMVFEESKLWPKEEIYALTSQIRRSSRAIGAAMAEAWAKRRYPAHFLSKMTDADAEPQESQHWIDTAYASGYLSGESKEVLHPALPRGRKIDWGNDGKTREFLPFFVPRREKMSIAVLQKAGPCHQSSGLRLEDWTA